MLTSREDAVLGDSPPAAYATAEDAPQDFTITRIQATGYGAWLMSIIIAAAYLVADVAITWALVPEPSIDELYLPWQVSLLGFGCVACIAALSWFAAPRIRISPRDNVFEYGRKSYDLDELAMIRVCDPEIRILRNWTEVIVLPFDWASAHTRQRLPEIADHLNTALLWRERHHAALASLDHSKQPGGPFRVASDSRRQS